MQNQQTRTHFQETQPLVTFIVTYYNLPIPMLCECINSILAQATIVGDLRIPSNPDTVMDAAAQEFDELAVQFRPDDHPLFGSPILICLTLSLPFCTFGPVNVRS